MPSNSNYSEAAAILAFLIGFATLMAVISYSGHMDRVDEFRADSLKAAIAQQKK